MRHGAWTARPDSRMPCRVAALVLAAVSFTAAAFAQVPGPESFAQEPRTPLELWGAIDYLSRTGQSPKAVPYLDKFLKSQPSDEDFVEIRDRYGIGSILRLADDPTTRRFAEPISGKLADAAQRHATQPERLARFVAGLTGTPGGTGFRGRAAQGSRSLRGSGPGGSPQASGNHPRGSRDAGAQHGPARPLGGSAAPGGARQRRRRPGGRRGHGPGAYRRSASGAFPDLPGLGGRVRSRGS